MKSLFNFSSLKWVLSLSILFCLVTFIGCKKSPPPPKTAGEQALENIAVTWGLGTVTRETLPVNAEFQGFVLVMDGSKTFSTTNGMDIFPAGTQWDFNGEVTNATGPFQITAGGVDMEVTSLTSTNLILTFSYTAPGGRIANLDGEYVFSLVKQ